MLGRHGIQADVVALGKHRVRALTLEGETDELWSAPVTPGAPEAEGAVVESPAHPEAPSPVIDADQGHHDQVEPSRRDRVPR
jgi:hypothetical protein